MQNTPTEPPPTRPAPETSEQFQPPVTRWNLPAQRLQGVPFQSPVAKVNTATCPLRPSRVT